MSKRFLILLLALLLVASLSGCNNGSPQVDDTEGEETTAALDGDSIQSPVADTTTGTPDAEDTPAINDDVAAEDTTASEDSGEEVSETTEREYSKLY